MKLQEQSFKDYYLSRVYQTEVSRTKLSGYTKTQDHSEVCPIV